MKSAEMNGPGLIFRVQRTVTLEVKLGTFSTAAVD